jgi:uncharacterized protein (TIGR03083 family)
MDVAAYLDEVRRNGKLLADAAAGALDRPVPSCEGWRVRDLLKHTGMVHRWAAANVVRACGEPMTEDERHEAVGPYPADESLVRWFRDGCAALVDVLESADPGVRCWTFMAAPSPLAFWARRQAHETAIHRVDAESAGGKITPVPAGFAADGIDELLTGFLPRSRRAPTGRSAALAVRATDARGAGRADWLVRLGPEPVGGPGEEGLAQCRISGNASDLYLLLWNRRGGSLGGIDVAGDASVLSQWHENVQVKWR